MTEIEQLRQDIEQAKEIMLRFYKQDRQALGIGEMYDRLAKLEAEAAAKADPWAIEKQVIETLLKWSKATHGNAAARYARHLECQVDNISAVAEVFRRDFESARKRIAELEAELAKRPVVWCVRHKGNILKQSASPSGGVWDCYHFTGLFPTRLDAAKLMRGEPEPYTGEQS